VVLYEQIRRAVLREESSIRELSRRFGVHRREGPSVGFRLAGAAGSEAPPRPSPVLDRWKPVIDVWLVDDCRAPTCARR
jgi:hypothetical protein